MAPTRRFPAKSCAPRPRSAVRTPARNRPSSAGPSGRRDPPRALREALSRREFSKQLDLSRVVEIVRGRARDHGLAGPAPEARGEGVLGQFLHELAERAVLALEKGPCRIDLLRGRTRRSEEEIRAGERERSALLAREPPPHDILPVRRVESEVVDGVAVGAGPEERDRGREAPERALEVRPVPRAAVVCPVQSREEMRPEVHAALSISARAFAQPPGHVTPRAETSRERRGGAVPSRASSE